jgi:multidrug efflux system membrane fusion protein
MKSKRIVLVLSLVAVVALFAALIYGYMQMSKERAAEREREKPVASESKVSRNASGEIVLTMDEETQKRIALKIAALVPMQLEPEVKGYGRVLDPAPLSSLVAELVSARATAEASQKELERLKVLSAQDNASPRALQAAEAAAQRGNALAESARQRLLVAWGKGIADRAGLATFVQSLASGENALVRINLQAGEFLKTQPLGARLFALSDENSAVEAEFIGTAPAVDAQTQGQGFLFLVKSRQQGFTPGAALLGYLKIAGEAQSGVVIPRAAVTRFNGKPWIYLLTDADTFLRREISLERPLAEGWFAAQDMKPGDRVVVGGAQLLLSEEQKYQIHMGD